MQVGVIGMGWVGSSAAVSTLHTGIATEVLVYVAISLPAIVGHGGVSEILPPDMSAEEQSGLERSVEVLRNAAAHLRPES